MLNYLFDKFEHIKAMIFHCVNKSIIDILLRVLFIDIPFIDTKMTLFLVFLFLFFKNYILFLGTKERSIELIIRSLRQNKRL